jgi:hypothetical protein
MEATPSAEVPNDEFNIPPIDPNQNAPEWGDPRPPFQKFLG